MIILHVIPSLDIGGAQRLLVDLLPLQGKTNDVKLLVFKSADTTFQKIVEDAGIEIIDLHCNNFYNPLIIAKIYPYLKQCDVAHIHLFPAIYWVALASCFTKVKLVYTEHSTHNRRRENLWFRPIERYIYSKYDKLIGISEQTLTNLKAWLKAGKEDKRFVVVTNGVNLVTFSSKQSSEVSKKLVIMVSRFAAMKDQATVIRAMAYVDEMAELVLVGDGPQKKYCEELVKRLKLTDRIHFLGARSDIPQLVANAYIGVQSSIWEGFGLTAVELMAAHKPVLATSVDGLRQIVEGAGILFGVGDFKRLSFEINKLLIDKLFYASVADKCYGRSKKYDIKNTAKQYQMIYEKLQG